jgi:hypothetical protein
MLWPKKGHGQRPGPQSATKIIFKKIFGFILLAVMRQALTIYPPLFWLASFCVFKWCKKRKRMSPTASVCTLVYLL